MEEVIHLNCPCCKSSKCLVGRLDPSNVDTNFSGKFYPSYLQTSFFILDHASVDIEKNDTFTACTECGHLWSSVDAVEFRKVLKKHKWNEEPQVKPPPRKPYFQWFLAAIIGGLLLSIAFFNYNT